MDNDPAVSLCLDLGNTLQKLAVFRGTDPLHFFSGKDISIQLEGILKEFHPSRSILCSVIDHDPAIDRILSEHTNFIRLDYRTPLPLVNAYENPSTLGPDRIALAAGAASMYAQRHVLAISAGTCITFNFVNRAAEFLGGSISPGLQLRMEALHHFTGKLPLEKPGELISLIGYNTRQSILSGCQGGAVGEIDCLIGQYRKKYQGVAVALSGGDAPFFKRYLKEEIFMVPDLLFRGLLSISILNAP